MVNGSIALPIIPIYKNGAQIYALTGTVAETTMLTVSIPPAPGINARLVVSAIGSVTGSTNAKTLRLKYGGTTFHTQTITTAATVSYSLMPVQGGSIQNRGVFNAQVFLSGLASALVIGAIDSAVSQDLLITGQLASAGESITLEAVSVRWENY